MDAETLRTSLEILGWKARGNWDSRNVLISCPFAPRLHKSGTDSEPSMAIKIDADGPSPCICNSCGTKGLFLSVVRMAYESGMASYSGFLEVAALEIGSQNGSHTVSNPDRKKSWRDDLGVISCGRVARYILDRGIKASTCRRWELGFDSKRNRTVFPVKDVHGNDVGLFGREAQLSATLRYPMYPGWDTSLYLYGEHLVRERTGLPLIVVEGPLDALWVWQEAPYPVIGLLGLNLSPERILKLQLLTSQLVLFLDNDVPGQRALKRFRRSLAAKFAQGVWTVDYGGAKSRRDKSRPAKDPEELHPKRIERMIEMRSFFC